MSSNQRSNLAHLCAVVSLLSPYVTYVSRTVCLSVCLSVCVLDVFLSAHNYTAKKQGLLAFDQENMSVYPALQKPCMELILLIAS